MRPVEVTIEDRLDVQADIRCQSINHRSTLRDARIRLKRRMRLLEHVEFLAEERRQEIERLVEKNVALERKVARLERHR